MQQPDQDSGDDVIIRLAASAPRRAIMLAMMAGMGGLLVLLGFQMSTDQLAFKAFFVVVGLSIFGLLPTAARASARFLIIKKDGIYVDGGALLVSMENVRSVERGAFAFKPSNGFLVRLHKPQPRSWVPGIWWLQGRRLGVGGVIASGPAKVAAEAIVELSGAGR